MGSYDALHSFRRSFYECLHRWADALFELADAILAADGAPSPAHVSLQASHRRGWGSLYAALWRGRIDAESLQKVLACHPLAFSDDGETPVYAVDVSVWPRCDAECSPERGYYYHPSRHSSGQPIVAGWAYQFVAQLGFVRESWTAPVYVERVCPEQEANALATEQIKALLGRFPLGSDVPLFVFDASSTIPSSCGRGWREARARSSSVCEQDVASTVIRASLAHLLTPEGRVGADRR